MINYLKMRIVKRLALISLGISLILSGLQIVQSLTPILKFGNTFLESPYTRWFSVDPFNFEPIIFYILLPLIASIPTSLILKEDLDSGLIFYLRNKFNLNKIVFSYASAAFIGGFVSAIIPLVTNFLTYFLFIPNIRPDFLINENLLIINENTLFVDLYYQHPLMHGIFSILLTSFWGGLFAVLTCSFSIWIKGKFLSLLSTLLLQISILILNIFIKIPHFVSFLPSDFLRETAPSVINIATVIIMTIIFSLSSIFLLLIGRNRKIVW